MSTLNSIIRDLRTLIEGEERKIRVEVKPKGELLSYFIDPIYLGMAKEIVGLSEGEYNKNTDLAHRVNDIATVMAGVRDAGYSSWPNYPKKGNYKPAAEVLSGIKRWVDPYTRESMYVKFNELPKGIYISYSRQGGIEDLPKEARRAAYGLPPKKPKRPQKKVKIGPKKDYVDLAKDETKAIGALFSNMLKVYAKGDKQGITDNFNEIMRRVQELLEFMYETIKIEPEGEALL